MQSLHLIRDSSLWWVCIYFEMRVRKSGNVVDVDKNKIRREKRIRIKIKPLT